MTNNYKWLALSIFCLVLASVGNAAESKTGGKGASFSGFAEGGWNWQFQTGQKQTQFLLDEANMTMNFDVSEKTKVAVSNSMAMTNGKTVDFTGNHASNYFSNFRLTGTNGLVFANQAAYIEHKCGENWWTTLGHFRTPFGMENMWAKYEMPTYFYSSMYGVANTYSWNYDLGLKVAIGDPIPGKLEVAILDGRRNTRGDGDHTPAWALRWWYEWKNGDMSLTPVISSYLGRWRGGPSDLGFTGGLMWKMGTVWANAEFLWNSMKPVGAVDTKTKMMGFYLEPGVDLGMFEVSTKFDWRKVDGGNSDINLGFSVGHTYADKLRVRAVYQAANLSKKLGTNVVNDFRLLFGTSW